MANMYTVVSGDTLSRIGTKTGVPWRSIAKWNNITSPYIIHVGQSLRLRAPSVTPTPNPAPVTPTPVKPTPAPTGAFSTTAPIRDRIWGTYAETAGKGGTLWELSSLTDIETKLGYKFPVVSGFMDDHSATGPVYDYMPIENMKVAAAQGRSIVLSFDLEYVFADILSGKIDNKLKAYAAACASVSAPIYLRLWAEMNGDWAKWSVGSSGSVVTSLTEWIAAWKHVVGIFRNAGASNVHFMWCPNNDDIGKYKLEQYWPGTEWVDVLGFDGYNWGGNEWQTHTQVFQGVYNRLCVLDAIKPVWIGEFASAEGTGKAAWITALMNETGFPRLQGLCWFSVSKEKDWRMDSTTAATAAFKDRFNA